MNPDSLVERLFDQSMLAELGSLVDIDPTAVITRLDDAGRARLRDADLLLAGWGAPSISIDHAPRLKGLVYLGGVAATCLDEPGRWAERGLPAANARSANAIPVAEYALAMILLAGKDTFAAVRRFRTSRTMPDRALDSPRTGNYRTTVGIIGLSRTATRLIELLRPLDLEVVVYDPTLTPQRAEALGIMTAGLDEVVAGSDIVSLHQALTPATTGQIDARLLASMRDGATLLNTARGAVVDQGALVREVRAGRINAILDVTDPEPLPPEHELWSLPNAVLTPHLAGSTGGELRRIGASAVDEVRRFAAGQPFCSPEELG